MNYDILKFEIFMIFKIWNISEKMKEKGITKSSQKKIFTYGSLLKIIKLFMNWKIIITFFSMTWIWRYRYLEKTKIWFRISWSFSNKSL